MESNTDQLDDNPECDPKNTAASGSGSRQMAHEGTNWTGGWELTKQSFYFPRF